MTKGLLIAAFNYSGAHADEFHDWYDLEHIPERKAVSGFGLCERWIGDEDANISIATYDLDTVDVMRSDAYCAIGYANSSVWTKRVTGMCTRLLRFDGTQITPGDAAAVDGAGALLVNAMNVALEGEVDFNAWYDEEHLPGLSAVPGTLAARRYRARDDDEASEMRPDRQGEANVGDRVTNVIEVGAEPAFDVQLGGQNPIKVVYKIIENDQRDHVPVAVVHN